MMESLGNRKIQTLFKEGATPCTMHGGAYCSKSAGGNEMINTLPDPVQSDKVRCLRTSASVVDSLASSVRYVRREMYETSGVEGRCRARICTLCTIVSGSALGLIILRQGEIESHSPGR